MLEPLCECTGGEQTPFALVVKRASGGTRLHRVCTESLGIGPESDAS